MNIPLHTSEMYQKPQAHLWHQQKSLAHILHSPDLRSALHQHQTARLLAEMYGISPLPNPILCYECLEDLPAFIDWERDEGTTEAINAYPHVWWHVLTCSSCAEQYLAICGLHQSQRKGEISIVPVLRWNLLHLARKFLNYALPSPNQMVILGTAMGPDSQDEMVLVDEQVETGHHVSLSFQEHEEGSWNMLISVCPTPDGSLVVRLGTNEFRAEFNHQGNALITGVPTHLLIESDVDLVVDVER